MPSLIGGKVPAAKAETLPVEPCCFGALPRYPHCSSSLDYYHVHQGGRFTCAVHHDRGACRNDPCIRHFDLFFNRNAHTGSSPHCNTRQEEPYIMSGGMGYVQLTYRYNDDSLLSVCQRLLLSKIRTLHVLFKRR